MFPFKVKLKTKVALAVFSVVGSALLVLSLITYWNTVRQERELLARQMQSIGELQASNAEHTLAHLRRDLDRLARLIGSQSVLAGSNTPSDSSVDSLEHGNDSLAVAEVLKFLMHRPEYQGISIWTAEGRSVREIVVTAGDLPAVEIGEATAEAFSDMEMWTQTRPYLVGLGVERSSNLPILRVLAQSNSSGENRTRLLELRAYPELVFSQMQPPEGSDYSTFLILEGMDYIHFGPTGTGPQVMLAEAGAWIDPPFPRNAILPARQFLLGENASSIGYVAPVDSGAFLTKNRLNVMVLRDPNSFFSAASAGLRYELLAAIMLTIAAAGVAYFFASRLLKPLSVLNKQIKQKTGHFETIDFVASGYDEVSELATGFANLANDVTREGKRLEAILRNAADGVVTISVKGTIEDVNPAAEKLFGYKSEELVGRPIEILMRNEDASHHKGWISKTRLDRGVKRLASNREIWGITKRGTEIPLDIAVSKAVYSGATHFIGVIRDISERKEADQRLKDLIAALKRSNAELDQFAYVASHDLKAPLRVINNAATWLAEDLEPHLTEDSLESLDLLKNRVVRMERLLEDLLQHSRIGRVASPQTIVSGQQLSEEILGLLDVPEDMNIQFSDAFRAITVRQFPLETVLLNLVSNAIKHHDRLDGKVWVDAKEVSEGLELTVEDDGPGIPQEYHEKIFEVFQTLKPRDELEASGMGLAFVKKHIVLMNASIDVQSDGKRGTKFVIVWPKGNVAKGVAA